MDRIKVLCSVVLILCSLPLVASSREGVQQTFVQRTHQTPQIDGIIEPAIWGISEPISEFIQYDPVYSSTPTQATEVRILYNDRAVFIAARMYDNSADSILKQLGQRDSSPNADAFGIKFDTYNNQLDAYTFEVYASGVQRDFRQQDHTYDGVWESAVNVDEDGWTVEMRIPYSALRFPSTDCQTWGLQIYRNIRRHREHNQWALEDRDANNRQMFWGQLSGLCEIKAPLQLSLTPYLSTGTSHYPHGVKGVNNFTNSFGGGVDLMYGINESYSLNMTLMPDFSQVPSDNLVKNLSAFETVYGEQRPFFKENMDLFERGDLFYSRRIGGRPVGYHTADDQLAENEVVVDNPAQSRLINAFKLSGRNANGLAIGLFNAITDNTYARVEGVDGLNRKIQTDPSTNYNILVFDQAMANNSSAYLINTNVLRSGDFRHANVTGGGATLIEKSNTYQVRLSGAFTQLYQKTPDESGSRFNVDLGGRYSASIAKIKGNFRFSLNRSAINPEFNDNDLGITHRNNEITDNVNLQYNIYEPFWRVRNWRNSIRIQNQGRYNNYQIENTQIEYNTSTSTMGYTHLSQGFYFNPRERYDYYEARTSGRVFVRPKGMGGYASLSSDYRKPFAMDLNVFYSVVPSFDNTSLSYSLTPRYRFSDQFSFMHTFRYNLNQNDVGFAGKADDVIVFGNRDITTVENILSSDYIVNDDMYFSFRLRQYWSKGQYEKFSSLLDNGRLDNDSYNFSENRDFNFNSFNIDLVFTWLFAPGSSLNLVWKNAILHEQSGVVNNYFNNFAYLADSPKYNSLSLKLLYYLDYQMMKGA